MHPDNAFMINRRDALAATLAASVFPLTAQAKDGGGQVVLGVSLEPPSLDPTTNPAACIGEIVHYNVFETLTRIRPDGSVLPFLAERWLVSPDARTIQLHLRKDVRFHNGVPFDASTVKFSLERAGAPNSPNKDRQHFATVRVRTINRHTVVLENDRTDPDMLLRLGLATAAMVEPASAETNALQPVGTGPYRLAHWQRGTSIVLTRWAPHRDAARTRMERATFRFISEPEAQAAALEASTLDLFAGLAPQKLSQFRARTTFQTLTGDTRAKTLVAINQSREPLDDVRVRRAIASAIDRKAVLNAAGAGLGHAIGGHFTPGGFGYLETTGINAFDPDRARSLLDEANIRLPLTLTLALPPSAYAQLGGPVVAEQLAAVGIQARLQHLDWPEWLNNVYREKRYDLALISHVEPLDLGRFAEPDYYWQYRSDAFDALWKELHSTADPARRADVLGKVQRLLAADSVHAYLYCPQSVTVAHHRLRGLQRDRPVPVNDLAALYWA